MELSGLKLSDIHPSQFYISLEKLRQVEKWFRPDDLSHFEPVPVKYLNGRIIFTDGHTRAFAAYRKGLAKIPLVWDEDELDWCDTLHEILALRRSRPSLYSDYNGNGDES